MLIRLFKFYSLCNLNFSSFTNLMGLKLKLKGKIAVGGNSRTRTLYYSEGYTGASNYISNIMYSSYMSSNIPGTVNLKLFYYKLGTDYTKDSHLLL